MAMATSAAGGPRRSWRLAADDARSPANPAGRIRRGGRRVHSSSGNHAAIRVGRRRILRAPPPGDYRRRIGGVGAASPQARIERDGAATSARAVVPEEEAIDSDDGSGRFFPIIAPPSLPSPTHPPSLLPRHRGAPSATEEIRRRRPCRCEPATSQDDDGAVGR